MPQMYQSFASTLPSRVDNAYILSLIATTGDGLAAITSASELLLVDRRNLGSQSTYFQDVPNDTNCLIRDNAQGQSLICSSSNGSVTTFDVRTQKKVAQFRVDRSVTAIASDGLRIAVGTELKSQQAIVSLWDARQTKEIWRNGENSDDITAVDFHPGNPQVVLAGGDDGLVSLFDTNIQDEEESLLQAVSHGPIHKAGFLNSDQIFALSSDQNLAIYPISTPDDAVDPPPILLGDLRPILPCQYAIDILASGNDFVLAAGTNLGASRIDLVRLDSTLAHSVPPALDLASRHILEPAHGEEIVRAVAIDDNTGVIFTGGEDGRICAFKQDPMSTVASAQVPKVVKSKKGLEGRYKPY